MGRENLLFESQLPFTSFRHMETLAFLLTVNLKSSITLSAARCAHPASNTSILTVKEGLCVETTWVRRGRVYLVRNVEGSLDESRDERLIEFEVGVETVEVEDEGFEVE